MAINLFFDIETVSSSENFDQLDNRTRKLWEDKCTKIRDANGQSPAELYKLKAALYPEFSKVVCVSTAYRTDVGAIRTKSWYGADEIEDILKPFANMLAGLKTNRHNMGGHNIKTFDIPFLVRRYITNKLKVPKFINTLGCKPWELKHLIDTRELWKFGAYESATLDLLCYTLGVPTPKGEMDGSKVNDAYWVDQDIESIAKYCEKDTVSNLEVYERIVECTQ